MPAAARRLEKHDTVDAVAAANPVALLHAELRERLADAPAEWAVVAVPLARRRIAPLIASGAALLALVTVVAATR